jgi:hypothetical protein
LEANVIFFSVPGCDIPAEIMILTHGSENINEYNWNKNKDFIASLIRNLNVGQNSHHMGMIVYGASVGDGLVCVSYSLRFGEVVILSNNHLTSDL